MNLIERDKYDGGGLICPAPTLEEILEDLRKDSEPYFTVFKEWCEAQCDNRHAAERRTVDAAMKLWLAHDKVRKDKSEDCVVVG